METLSFVFSALSMLTFTVANVIKARTMGLILLLNMLGNGLMAAGYLCGGTLSGMASCGVAMLMCLVNYFLSKQEKSIPNWLAGVYIAAFIAANAATFVEWADLVAVLACVVAVLALCAGAGRVYRRWVTINNGLWVLFDLCKGAYGPLVPHIVQFGCALTGVILHDRKHYLKK